MAYIRSKNIHGHTRYQVVEDHRVAGRVQHRVLWDLGQYSTVEEAVADLRNKAAKDRQSAETVRQRGQRSY